MQNAEEHRPSTAKDKEHESSALCDGQGTDQKEENGGNRNANKRARVFDLTAIFEETKKTAELCSAEAADKRKIIEAEKEASGVETKGSNKIKQTHGSVESVASTASSVAVDEDSDDDDFLPALPPGFQPDKSVILGTEEEKASITKSVAKGSDSVDNEDDQDSDFEDYAGEGIPIVKLIPASCEAKLKHSGKPVSALRFEPVGVRFSSGGLDYQLKVFDFQKMDMSMRPDKELSPCESHVINSVAFSSNGETLIVCSGQAQIRLLDRKGKQWAETIRGDQYLVDVSNTKGHTAAVNCCQWNPIQKGEFLTCSDDGTLRLWHLDDYKELTRCINKHRKVIKTKTANGKRAMPQTCCYSPDGKLIAAGCDDGSIQIWKYGNIYVNTVFLARNAHRGPITSLAFSPDSQKILSRGLDDAMRLWSLKAPKKPLHEVLGLENAWRSTDCGFSPRGELVYTGTSSPNDQTPGKLLFFNSETLDLVYKMEFPELTVMRIDWHPRLNQILVGFNDGSIKIYYDQQMSDRGVMGCVSKPIKRSRASEVVREEMVLSPLALEMFQPRGEEGEEKEVSGWRLKKYLRMRDNQMRPEFRKPADIPMDGPSAGGRVAASGSTLHSYLAKQIGTQSNRSFLEDTDVRASILRHAEAAAADPQYIDKAYRKNQPKPIFQEKSTAPEDEEEETELQPLFKMPRLG